MVDARAAEFERERFAFHALALGDEVREAFVARHLQARAVFASRLGDHWNSTGPSDCLPPERGAFEAGGSGRAFSTKARAAS